MIKRQRKGLIARWGLLVVLGAVLVVLQPMQQAVAENTSATDQKIIHYVRERFGVPDTTKLTVAPFQNSQYDNPET